MIDRIRSACKALDEWIEAAGFKGWDPHDALNSPLLKLLSLRNHFLSIAWVQLFKRSPLNLRPFVGVVAGHNPKAMGLFLASYWRKYLLTSNEKMFENTRNFAQWLEENVSKGYCGACWGYNFDWPNRNFFAPTGTPTIVNTAFIGLALMDLVLLPRPAIAKTSSVWGSMPSTLARSACRFILRDLNRKVVSPDEFCFSYTPLDRRCVHNANVMGALLLATVYSHTRESELADCALAAAHFTARRQRSDGAWPYGDQLRDSWIDNFHTAYLLVALKRISEHLHICEFESAIRRGYAFWKNGFFRSDGAPKYFVDRDYPVDAHCVAQAILTFLEFQDSDAQAWDRAWELAGWSVDNLQDRRGYFHYQIHRSYRIRIPYIRWTQAWMQRALTELIWEADGAKRNQN